MIIQDFSVILCHKTSMHYEIGFINGRITYYIEHIYDYGVVWSLEDAIARMD